MSSGKVTIQIRPGAEGLIKSLGLFSIQDGWREDLPGHLVNDRRDRQVLQLAPPPPDTPTAAGRIVYLKRWRFAEDSPYRYLPGKNALRHRATTEFENLQRLTNIGVRVPEPLFLAEENGLWGPVASLLLLEGLVEYVPASEWIHKHKDGAEFLCLRIACLMATLHRNDYFYRSPGLKHFYVRKQKSKSDPSRANGPDDNLALIDVPRLDRGCRQWLKSPWQWLGADPPCPERDLSKVFLTLTQELGASKKELEVFWSTYSIEVGVGKEAEALRRRVLDLAKARAKRRRSRS